MHKPGLFGMNGFMVFFLSFFSAIAHAQQPGYLILIEAENRQSFIVRIGDQFYASSAQGHLVLSQLKDSSYRLKVRFPKNNLPEQVFPVAIRHKDLGLQLKGADSSWVLYNWLTKETIHPVFEFDSSRILDLGVKRQDGFSRLMAAVVDDSTVMYNTYTGNGFKQDSSNAKKPGIAVDSTQLAINPPSPNKTGSGGKSRKPLPPYDGTIGQPTTQNVSPPIANTVSGPKEIRGGQSGQKQTVLPVAFAAKKPGVDSLLATNNKPSSAIGHPSSITPAIKKLRELSLKISRKIVYQEIGKDGQIDTITLFIFFETNDSLSKKPGAGPVLASIKPVKSTDTSVINKTLVKNKTPIKSGEQACVQTATEGDLAFLRDAVLKANTVEAKIGIATEAFSIKCFTVSQVRLLTSLFVSDKDKYKLMDAAHKHISDRDHFRELVDMLTDKNFQRKFLVMADKRS